MMAIGVSYDEFWHGDPEIVRYAIEAYQIRERNEAIKNDVLAWSIGAYTMQGVGVVIARALSKSAGVAYPDSPQLAISLDEQLARKKQEEDVKKMHSEFLAVAAALERANRQRGSAQQTS